jgi:regulator of protease activity HflC (stomatin/prohibitin superfamily)
MTRVTVLASAAIALTLTLGVGCDKAADEQQKANAAQTEADKKIAEANKEAVTKTTGAQIEADKKIANAEGDFGKRREDYRHTMQSNLVDIDKKVDLLEAKSKAATGKAKADLDARLSQIRVRRAAFGTTISAVATTTAPQWDDTKVRVDKEWSELNALVDKAD